MTFSKIFGVLVVLSLPATGAAMARDISSGTAGVKGKTASLVKENKVTRKSGQGPVSVRQAKPQATIARSAVPHAAGPGGFPTPYREYDSIARFAY
jgi:hypothetical protein